MLAHLCLVATTTALVALRPEVGNADEAAKVAHVRGVGIADPEQALL